MAYGFSGHLGIAKETTWGTAVVAADYFKALSESIVTDIERFDVHNIIGGLFEADDESGLNRHAGDIVLAGHPVSIGYMLNGTFGVNSITEILSGFLYANEFNMATVDENSLHPLPPYTLEVFRDVTSSQQFAGVNFNTLQLGVAANQDLRVTASVIAKTRTNIAATTASFPGSPTGVFKFDTASISIAGSAISRMEAFNLSVDNQLEGVPALENIAEITRIKRTGPQLIRLSGTMAFEDQTDKDAFLAQTEQRIVASFTKADSFALVIDIPRFIFTSFPDQMTGRDRLTVDFEGKGLYHTGSASALRVTLTTVNTF